VCVSCHPSHHNKFLALQSPYAFFDGRPGLLIVTSKLLVTGSLVPISSVLPDPDGNLSGQVSCKR